jgi:hypothetical protein
MVAPVQRTWMLPDGQVHTGAMPLMFYAPNLTDEYIGAVPNSDIAYPFMFKEVAQQSYIIQMGKRKSPGSLLMGRRLSPNFARIEMSCAFRRNDPPGPPVLPLKKGEGR